MVSGNMGNRSGVVELIIDNLKQYRDDVYEKYTAVVHCVAHDLELVVCDTKEKCKYMYLHIYLKKF